MRHPEREQTSSPFKVSLKVKLLEVTMLTVLHKLCRMNNEL
jgi:hypothetical protein